VYSTELQISAVRSFIVEAQEKEDKKCQNGFFSKTATTQKK
jgi:hypothetical protein